MIVKKQLSTLKAYSPGKTIDEVKRQYGLTKIVKLASNENPFGSSPKVGEALAELPGKLALYPDGAAYALRQKTAGHLGVQPEQLLFGSGLDEVIQMVSRALLEKGTNVVMAKPTFSQYRHHAIIENAELREVPLKDGVHDLEAMLAQVDENTRIAWICNPNNPTGTYVSKEEVQSFAARVPKTTLVIVDEAYFEYASAPDYASALELLPDYENLMVMRTFSKAYGIAALRMGYAVAHADLIGQLEVARLPFNTSAAAQVAALAALEDQQFLQNCVAANQEGLQQYYDFCEKHGLKYYPSQGNFIFMEVGKPGDEVFQQLLQKGYIVRSGGGLGLPEGIRITVGSKEENEEIIAVLEQVVQETKETAL
ncbi:histidinol-phosphate transaminase [Ectobacillus ponti]|uniref:Histidinol-phosphate aminotransferase n=1 Tax=Ectobacillus ponti TaxID=2961894 RepID=A0AA41X9C1_9BACI|nr:histidinol-phosphate transaminase [Ectobacillus ponti]MCP8968760.1 histidinol-phosphate transaminase [Ectobacillus ponti]